LPQLLGKESGNVTWCEYFCCIRTVWTMNLSLLSLVSDHLLTHHHFLIMISYVFCHDCSMNIVWKVLELRS